MADMALNQISEALPDAIDTVFASLPGDFPTEIRHAIAGGASTRLERIISTAAAR